MIKLFGKALRRHWKQKQLVKTVKDIFRLSRKLAKHVSRLSRHIAELINVKANFKVFLTGLIFIIIFLKLRPHIRELSIRRQGQNFAPQLRTVLF